MALRFFQNAIDSGVQPMAPEMYRDLEQEFVNLRWDDTTALVTMQEQQGIGSETFSPIDVWVDSTVADTTRGLTDTRDFNKIIFQDITHSVVRGQLYIYENNYWIVHSYNEHSGVVQFCGIRRCNNRLKIIDPTNGYLWSFPCCVDYDMTSPSQQTSRYIITPNNHATVIVQGNDNTLRLLKTNTRFMLSGRPFKLLSYQNAVEYNEDITQTTLLYLDLYLDEIDDKDDIENNIAFNGRYDYTISINSENMSLLKGTTGKLTATTMLNGVESNNDVVWSTSNRSVVSVNTLGEYSVNGNVGGSCVITATISGNTNAKSNITITVASEQDILPIVSVSPTFNKIRQYESINFFVSVDYGGIQYNSFDTISVAVDNEFASYINLISNENGSYTISGVKPYASLIPIKIIIQNASPEFNINEQLNVQVVSMMG